MNIQKKKSVLELAFCILLLHLQGWTITANKLLLISLDGFRWDFASLGNTPTLDWIKENGVTAESVRNVFPTNTIPNHQSIVTGMYPENHGMLNNNFLDKKLEKVFDIAMNESFLWNQSVPIWIENEQQGHKSGVIYWPGFNVHYDGKLASYTTASDNFKEYDIPFSSRPDKKTFDFSAQIELVINWLNNPQVNFVAFYTDEPDSCFHKNGPDKTDSEHDKIIRQCAARVDARLKSILHSLKRLEHEDIDVIITGDHGHVNLNSSRVIWYDDYIEMKPEIIFFGYTSVFMYVKNPMSIYDKLKGASLHFDVFLKEDIPEKFHIKNNERSPDILLIGESGWVIGNRLSKPWFNEGNGPWTVGDHGFSNYVRDMTPGFYAFGPSFKENFTVPFIETTDIYELMCHIINIKPHKNDGNFTRIKEVLS